MASTTDPADEAGGEVVYSSDGLSPVPVTKAPPIQASSSSTTVEEEAILDSSEVSPQNAFEVFQGKVYTAKTLARTPVVISRGEETPLETLARLQQEVDQLEAHFKTTTSVENAGRDFDEQLVELATSLKTRLNAASTTRTLEHDDLTRLIRQQLKTLQQTPNEQGTASATATSTTTTTPSTGVVYELYGNASKSSPTTTMEERLMKLERLLGSSQNLQGVQKSLVHRLEELESLVKTVDAATLEQTATKAKVIRADLEAASKARNKLTATYKKEDSKMIQQLHQQMTELEGLSGYLPSLANRLQQLAGLHVQASTFSTRLEELERSANQLESTVSQLDDTQKQLQTNMVDNIQTMEINMQKLDERLNQL